MGSSVAQQRIGGRGGKGGGKGLWRAILEGVDIQIKEFNLGRHLSQEKVLAPVLNTIVYL